LFFIQKDSLNKFLAVAEELAVKGLTADDGDEKRLITPTNFDVDNDDDCSLSTTRTASSHKKGKLRKISPMSTGMSNIDDAERLSDNDDVDYLPMSTNQTLSALKKGKRRKISPVSNKMGDNNDANETCENDDAGRTCDVDDANISTEFVDPKSIKVDPDGADNFLPEDYNGLEQSANDEAGLDVSGTGTSGTAKGKSLSRWNYNFFSSDISRRRILN
jgi:hypothetical protein